MESQRVGHDWVTFTSLRGQVPNKHYNDNGIKRETKSCFSSAATGHLTKGWVSLPNAPGCSNNLGISSGAWSPSGNFARRLGTASGCFVRCLNSSRRQQSQAWKVNEEKRASAPGGRSAHPRREHNDKRTLTVSVQPKTAAPPLPGARSFLSGCFPDYSWRARTWDLIWKWREKPSPQSSPSSQALANLKFGSSRGQVFSARKLQ